MDKQIKTIWPLKRTKFCHLQQHGCNWSTMLSEISQNRKTNTTCSHSYTAAENVDPKQEENKLEEENRLGVIRG